MSQKPSNAFVPTMAGSTRFSMAGDDCSLHFELEHLTPKQRDDHIANQNLTGMLQVALLFIQKPGDEVCLYDAFKQSPWTEALDNYHRLFAAMGLSPAPLSQVQYHPKEGYYESVAHRDSHCESETLYMVSGSNLPLHQSKQRLAISQNLNSKVHFAAHAPPYGLPTPDTLHCKKSDLQSKTVTEFFQLHAPQLMLKTLGLAGARNVTVVDGVNAAEAYVTEYDENMDIILQQRLHNQDYVEMTVDLCVSDNAIEITNVRQLLFADGLWVGNLMGSAATLTEHHRETLLRVGEYSRAHGYSHEFGLNLGIDYFVRRESSNSTLPELVITEINARWTGGLFPAELVRRLDIKHLPVVAFIDMCPVDAFKDYQTFVEDHLYQPQAPTDFSIAPMGFSPYPVQNNAEDCLFIWQIVIGDFAAFHQAIRDALAPDVMPTAMSISTEQHD